MKMRRGVFLLLGALAVSCGTDSWDVSEMGADDPRLHQLRRRLDIRIQTGMAVPGCDSVAGLCSPEAFASAVETSCPAPTWTSSSCETPAANASRKVCVAETLLRLAQAAEAQAVPIGNGILVPPQDSESQAELARLARNYAFDAMTIALDGLNTGCDLTTINEPAAAAGSTAAGLKQGTHVAGFAREGYHLFLASSELMVRFSAAVSDAQRSRSTDSATAEVAELAPFASRAAAAHMLVGGEHRLPGLRNVNANGFLPQGRLSAEGALAMTNWARRR